MAGIGVDRVYERRLAALVNSREQRLIARGRRGLERESLRVTSDGHIAQTPHPRSLGSSLTNPHITTDYSEALIELVTPTFNDNEALLQYLGDLHQFVYRAPRARSCCGPPRCPASWAAIRRCRSRVSATRTRGASNISTGTDCWCATAG